MSQTIDAVYRDFNTAGVPASGDHQPRKPEIRALLKQIQNAGGQAVTRNTLTALQAVTPPNENFMGVVLTGAGAGYYSRVAGVWVFGRPFADTFAKVALSGTGTAQTGALNAGVTPSSVEVFFAKVATPNTGPLTLSLSGGPARQVVNLAGNPLSAGEWTGMVTFYLNDADQYQLLIDAGAAAAAAASATRAEEEADRAQTIADGIAPGTVTDLSVTEPKLSAPLASALIASVANRTGLKALNTGRWKLARLGEDAREGMFVWRAGDYSANVANDSQEGIYIKADGVAATLGAWVREYTGAVNIMWFGAKPSNSDNTSAYNAAISVLSSGTSIFWPKITGVWKGHFLPPVGRSFRLDLGGNTFSETGNFCLFYMRGSAAVVTTLTANARYGQTTLAVASTTGLAAGDLIMLEDGFVRPDGGNKINQEILRVKAVLSGTSLRVEDCVRSEQKVGTRNVYKITPIVGAEIRNGRAVILDPWNPTRPETEGNFCQPFRIDYSSGAVAEKLEANNSYAEGVNFRYAYDFLLTRCAVFDGHYRSAGAYGVSVYVGRKGRNEYSMTRNTRNGSDLHACYDVTIYEPDHDDCNYGIAIAHNITGGKIAVIRPKVRNMVAGQGSRGILQGTQGLTDQAAVDYILRDITITEADLHTLALPTTAGSDLVYLSTSVSNLHIDGVTGRFPGVQTKPVVGTCIVRIVGQPFGLCVVKHIRTQSTYDGVDFYGVGFCVNADQVAAAGGGLPYGVLQVEDCHNGFGQSVIYARGVRNIITKNLTYAQDMTVVRDLAAKNGVTLTVDQSIGYHGRVS